MINLEHKLTVYDLIVEYMIYKVKNGYETNFYTSEFISFLYFFESEIEVEDSIYSNDKLFERFFERKNNSDWMIDNESNPHMDIEYIDQEYDYLIKANYKLSDYDSSVINTYFMKSYEVEKIRNIIKDFLEEEPLRKIDISVSIDDDNLIVGKYIVANIINNIWNNYVIEKIDNGNWPKQCLDINKYLLQIDLSEIVGLKSIKKDLLEFYDVVSKRIAILYSQDKNLKISSNESSYLANANYKLIMNGYEDLVNNLLDDFSIDLLDITNNNNQKEKMTQLIKVLDESK